MGPSRLERPLRFRARPWIAILGLLASSALLGCQDDAARLTEHMERGDAYREEGAFPEAIIEYRNALQLDPNAAAAHWGLAQSYLKSDKLRDGYWELRETVRLDPAHTEARLQFGTLSRLAGEIEEALVQADAVIEQDPESHQAFMLRGQALEALDRDVEARDAYAQAVELEPEGTAPLILLANYLVRQGLDEDAEPLFVQLTEIEPNFPSWAAYAGFLGRDRDRDTETEAAYKKALELAEEEKSVLASRLLANFYYNRDRTGEAEQVLIQAVETHPDDLDLIYLMARFYAAQGQPERADQMVEEATRARPGEVGPLLILSAYRGRNGDLEGALAAAEQALEVDPTSAQARLRKAEILLDVGFRAKDKAQIAQGRSIVDAVLAKDDSLPAALFVKAKIDMAEQNLEPAIASLRRAIDRRPDWAQAHFVLGSALFLSGDRNGSRAELTRALEIDADLVDARRVLARVFAAQGENDLAVEEGRRVLKARPNDDETRILVAQSLVRLRRIGEAKKELDAIPEERRSPEALFALGRVALLERDVETAYRSLLAAHEGQPGQPEILRSLLEIEGRAGRIELSVQRIQNAQGQNPDDVRLTHLLALAHLLSGKPGQAEELLRKAIDQEPNYLAAYQTLARLLIQTGRVEESTRTYERALENRPDSPQIHFVLGTLAEVQGDQAKAIEHYEDAVRLAPDFAVARNNLAYLLAEQGADLDRALDLAQEAKALLPDHPSAADTLGWVLFKKGIPSAAVGYLKEAEGGFEATDPNLAIVRHHLAQAYEANGELDEARSALQRALADLDVLRAEGASEPAWVADLRGMYERLGGTPAPAPAPAPDPAPEAAEPAAGGAPSAEG